MEDISGFGSVIDLKATKTFPSGFSITQFADDADPFDVPSIQIADKGMGVNGDLVVWSKPAAITVAVNVVPGGEDDKNLATLLDANRVSKGKNSVRDVITMTQVYPDGSTITLSKGKITDGMPVKSISSAGRLKTPSYLFVFENVTRSNS
ncbi:hypothetical protein LPW36_01960 [Jinshanibacter sp. LJY008]|uniref:Uncharacterized protein n=1 Tax=Limnobaculum eriocheiris TaxID=2897391 RepID=A0A9X1MTU3_9GAMM|nr:hypothetical protein [Limnobaculum eriocheiris]MCD1124809.1 hypothetical protein [Limnobaculum eriocheiris]